ncbi:YceD family protein [Maritalea sp.]|uniref:YceD family protein n=1 Tax=Maritalea sp. TaxID=2003361 RepID=UPI003EF6A8D5
MSDKQERRTHSLTLLLDIVARLDEISVEGRKYDFDADEEGLAWLTQNSPASQVSKFVGHVELRPIRGGYEATGKLVASLQQPCVITLEPVDENIDIEMRRIFMRGEEPEMDVTSNGEVFIDLEASADNEWFNEDKIDLSEFVLEQFLLSINPYPKKDGAVLPELNIDDEPAEKSPFAALAALKKSD